MIFCSISVVRRKRVLSVLTEIHVEPDHAGVKERLRVLATRMDGLPTDIRFGVRVNVRETIPTGRAKEVPQWLWEELVSLARQGFADLVPITMAAVEMPLHEIACALGADAATAEYVYDRTHGQTLLSTIAPERCQAAEIQEILGMELFSCPGQPPVRVWRRNGKSLLVVLPGIPPQSPYAEARELEEALSKALRKDKMP